MTNKERIANILRTELGVTPTHEDIQTVLNIVEPPPPQPKQHTDEELLRIAKNVPTGFAKELLDQLGTVLDLDGMHRSTSAPSLKLYRPHLHHFIARLMWYTHPEFYETVCRVESGSDTSDEVFRCALMLDMHEIMKGVVEEMMTFGIG